MFPASFQDINSENSTEIISKTIDLSAVTKPPAVTIKTHSTLLLSKILNIILRYYHPFQIHANNRLIWPLKKKKRILKHYQIIKWRQMMYRLLRAAIAKTSSIQSLIWNFSKEEVLTVLLSCQIRIKRKKDGHQISLRRPKDWLDVTSLTSFTISATKSFMKKWKTDYQRNKTPSETNMKNTIKIWNIKLTYYLNILDTPEMSNPRHSTDITFYQFAF